MSKTSLEFRRLQTEAFLTLGRMLREVERRIAEAFSERGIENVTPAQANALVVLFQAGEPLTSRKLARIMSLSEVTVGRFIRALERGGWVKRTRDPDDSRAILIRPTNLAYETLPGFISVVNDILDEAFEGIGERTIRRLARDIGRVGANLSGSE